MSAAQRGVVLLVGGQELRGGVGQAALEAERVVVLHHVAGPLPRRFRSGRWFLRGLQAHPLRLRDPLEVPGERPHDEQVHLAWVRV